MSIKMIKCGFCCEQFEYEKLISNYQYGGESHICINCNNYINKKSLAELIPIELINHILSFRPRHPVAELIKKLKENVFENIDEEELEEELDEDEDLDSLTFKRLKFISSFRIFGYYFDDSMIELNHIIKIQYYIVKKKPSYFAKVDMFYWGDKYHTSLNAYEAFRKCCNHNEMIYKASILVINIDTNEEDRILGDWGLDDYINKKFYDRVEELDYDIYQQTIEYADPDEMYDKLYDEMSNLKKPKLEDVLKSIKNDKTDYSYLFK